MRTAADEALRQQNVQNDLIGRDVRRQAASFVVQNFPDADEQQAISIAKDVEANLLKTSGPSSSSISTEEYERMSLERDMQANAMIPMATATAGAFVGGVPGASVGAGLGAVAESAFNWMAGKEDVDVLRNVRNKMALEIGGMTLFDMTAGSIARVFRGQKETADQITEAFREVGMRPSLQDVSTFPMTEGARNVLGSLPLLNRPFKQRAATVAREFQGALDSYIESVSPDTILVRRLAERGSVEDAARLQEQLAEGVFDGLARGYESLRNLRDQRFARLQSIESQLEARAADAGISLAVPSRNTRARIAQATSRIDNMTASIRSGAIEEPERLGQTVDFIRRLSGDEIAREMTFSELRRLKGRVGRQINAFSDDPTSVELLTRVKEGIEEDMVVAASRHPELQTAYDEAMEVSEEFLTIIQGIATQRGRQINRGLGRQSIQEVTTATGETIQKSAGARDVSTLVDTLAETGSPNEIRQFFGVLRRGVGDDEANRMIRLSLGKKIQRAAEAAFRESAEKAGDPSYKPGVLLRQLGLDSPNSKKFNATVALFEAAGMNTRQVMATSRVLDALFSVKNPRVSQFQQRQVTLGGPRTLLKSVTGGLIGGATATHGGLGLFPAIAFYTVGRSYGKWVTSPSRARIITTIADIRLPEHRRAQAFVSLVSDPYWWTSDDPEEQAQLQQIRDLAKEQLSTRAGQERFIRELDREIRFRPQSGGVR